MTDPTLAALAEAVRRRAAATGRTVSAIGLPADAMGAVASRQRADLVLEVVCRPLVLVVLPMYRPRLLRALAGVRRRRRRGEPDRPCSRREQRRDRRTLELAVDSVALLAADPDAVLRDLLARSAGRLAALDLPG